MLEEIDHLIGLSIDSTDPISRHQDADAINDRIMEWLETPEGTLADLPSWGHTLAYLQHEPPSENLEVMMECRILQKLPRDCRIRIQGIRMDFLDIDLLHIIIMHDMGIFDREVSRAVQR